jgi:hypothetical protein
LVLVATLPCGFEVTVSTACVDPRNFSTEMGLDIAKRKIRDRLWELEGYRLQHRLHGADDESLAGLVGQEG